MGTQISTCKPGSFGLQQHEDIERQINIYKWRADPKLNQYISKTFINQSFLETEKNHKKNKQYIQKLFKFQKYACNLEMLINSLEFQNCLYVLKSSMIGFQEIYNFLGKVYVDQKCCFVTRHGQIRVWINPNYQSNKFFCEDFLKQQYSFRDSNRVFLSEQELKSTKKVSISEANIIQNVINLVSKISKEQNSEYANFIQKLDKFIVSNILKNYNFKRINKFINRYVYENKINVPQNIRKSIEKLYIQEKVNHYQQSLISAASLNSSKSLNNYQLNSSLQSQYEESCSKMAKQNQSTQSKKMFFPAKQSLTKHQKSIILQQKTNQNYDSTAGSSNGFRINFNRFNQFSHTQYFPQRSINKKNQFFQNKNMILPQFSINLLNQSNQRAFSELDKKSVSFHTPKSSILSNKSSFKIKNSDLKAILQKNLGTITQKKQTEQSQANQSIVRNQSFNPYSQGKNFKNMDYVKQASSISQISSNSNNTFGDKQNKSNIPFTSGKCKTFFQNSTTSIHNKFAQENQKMFKSNCLQKRPSLINQNTYTSKKYEQDKEKSQFQFTVKTITRLISNDEEFEEHLSQGQFSSSHLNQSTYSGVLASMGRSVHLQQTPKIEVKNNFKKNQKANKILDYATQKQGFKSHQYFS